MFFSLVTGGGGLTLTHTHRGSKGVGSWAEEYTAYIEINRDTTVQHDWLNFSPHVSCFRACRVSSQPKRVPKHMDDMHAFTMNGCIQAIHPQLQLLVMKGNIQESSNMQKLKAE